jgi:hypothetical protein
MCAHHGFSTLHGLPPGTHLLLECAQQVCICLCCVGAGSQGQGDSRQESCSPQHVGLWHHTLLLTAAGSNWPLTLLVLPLMLLHGLPRILGHPLLQLV